MLSFICFEKMDFFLLFAFFDAFRKDGPSFLLRHSMYQVGL